MTTSEKLFATISNLIRVRVTQNNFRTMVVKLQTDGAYNQKMKNEILVELVMAIAEQDEQFRDLTARVDTLAESLLPKTATKTKDEKASVQSSA